MNTDLSSPDKDKKGAAVKFPPPLLFLTVMGLAYAVNDLRPLGLGGSSALSYIAALFISLGAVVIALAFFYFRQAQTHIEPWKPTTAIISSGIFSYSRNPIYLAFCFIQIGAGIFLNNAWMLISVLLSAFLVYHIAIKKEEAYLDAKFGEGYIGYKNRVRRWL